MCLFASSYENDIFDSYSRGNKAESYKKGLVSVYAASTQPGQASFCLETSRQVFKHLPTAQQNAEPTQHGDGAAPFLKQAVNKARDSRGPVQEAGDARVSHLLSQVSNSKCCSVS